jgi:DNA-binding beta-propeller fold protein YncE
MSGRARIPGLISSSLAIVLASAPAPAHAASGFGEIKGPGGCLLESGQPPEASCGAGKGLFHPKALAVSPDGTSVYVVGGVAGGNVAESFGTVTILQRNPTTGELSDDGCLSSDGTDGREAASGICTPTPSLLGADGVTVSADGKTVVVTTRSSASVVAFARDPTTGALTRLGCLQRTPALGSPCTGARVFSGSNDLLTTPDNSAMYVASPPEGTISAFLAPPPATAEQPSEAGAGTPPVTPAMPTTPATPTIASLFTAVAGAFVENPCIAVNGYDGACSVGVAMKGVGALTLTPEGKQLYAVAAASRAIDVFAPAGPEGLTETGCLVANAPTGLCSSSPLLESPTQLAVSPDGRNVYVADRSSAGGRIDVLSREASTGKLADVGCVDFLPQPVKPEPGEEEQSEEEHEPEAPDSCERVPGLESVQTLAISGDGSAVYAFGSSSAVSFARNPSTGALTETACAGESDSRCASLTDLTGVEAAAVSPDGQDVYVVTANKKALLAFGIGASVTSASAATTHRGLALVDVACPAHLSRPCRGRLTLTRLGEVHKRRDGHRGRTLRIYAGRSGLFAIAAGHHAVVAIRLDSSARRLLRGHRRLRVTAIVRADPFAGGSGFGRRLILRPAGR